MTRDPLHGQPVAFGAWPPSMRPEKANVYGHNEIVSPIPPERLWAWLIRARGWSQWYANCRRLKIENGGRELRLGTTFRWETFGTTITSTVDLFEPARAPLHVCRLGWSWYGSTAQGYHVWLLEPFEDGTRVITEESQRGLGPRLAPSLFRAMLRTSHGMWLRSLSVRGQRPPPRDT